MRTLSLLCCSAVAVAAIPQFLAAAPDNFLSHTLTATDATAAWEELHQASHAPEAPAAWQTTAPTAPERSGFYMPFVLALQDKSKDFYSKFPTNTHALDARKQEFQITMVAMELGATNQKMRLDEEEKSLLSQPAITEDDRTKVRGAKLQLLLELALASDPAAARPILQEIATNTTSPDQFKEQATAELKKLDSVGKPVELQFTAVDGRAVDLGKMKGKVVMIDFWATWCGPCVGEVPHVKETYDKLHSQGFEIVGISLDKEKDKLTQFVAAHKMDWPQYFDGLYWQNKYARQFGIESIPTMWLVDKKGVLRDLNGREDLAEKVTKLLAE